MVLGAALERSATFLPWRRAFRVRSAGVVYAFAILVGVLTITNARKGSEYLTAVNVSNVVEQSSLVGILAIFMTIVLITGNFDLSVASVAALSGAIALKVVDGYGPVLAIAAALACGLAVGVVNGLLVQKVGVNAFIVTLGTLTAVRGLLLVMLDGQSIAPTSTFFADLAQTKITFAPIAVIIAGLTVIAVVVFAVRRRIGRAPVDTTMLVALVSGVGMVLVALFVPSLLSQVLSVWLLLLLTAVMSLVLRYMVIGRFIYASGGNAEAARVSGVNVDLIKIGGFMLNGAMAALVGVLYAGKFNAMDPNSLQGLELTVIAAAILGGTSLFGGSGYVSKSVVGALILFTLANGFNVLNLGSNYQYLVQGAVLVAAATLYTVAGRRRSIRGVGLAAADVSSTTTASESQPSTPRQPVS